MSFLRSSMRGEMLERLLRIPDPKLHRWIADIVRVAKPSSVYVNVGDEGDLEYIRRAALANREELPTRNARHTAHFDGPKDLARDRGNTRILLSSGEKIPLINTYERRSGLNEIKELFRDVMKGKEMFVSFFCFGPRDSPFTLHAVQVTDSAYVTHSENILYRICYDYFVKYGENLDYLRFLHSAGERDANGWSKNIDKRRIYIDLEDDTVYSVNTQYAGNTVGLKKLALRLCVNRGLREGWLCEHMFITGVKGPGDRVTYFTGAFPAGCGKTSTALMSDTVVGDDLAIIKEFDGVARAVNPEVGMFGIVDGINPRDDPEIYEILTSPDSEVIFSNILLMDNGEVWWSGKVGEPGKGINYAGEWWPGKDNPPSHPNSRFTTSIRYLKTLDPRIDDPLGVPVGGMIFGGRDSDTLPPVEESFDWVHGIVTKGAALESERTTAVLGKAGEREFNPYAILDFLSISVGKFTELHLRFAEKLKVKPRVYGVNYFLKDENGNYLAEKVDKKVWLKWMELRVHNDVEAVETPTGLIPLYEDLKVLFSKHLNKDYPEALYVKQFMVRVPQQLSKVERIWAIYEGIPDAPRELFDVLRAQKERLKEAGSKWGDFISPFIFIRR
ncbi:MAG: phosphoenolpyruvate carboxykinase (GTP) [Zestosphaera sp.]